jgi:sulfite reductase (ferredoxin)
VPEAIERLLRQYIAERQSLDSETKENLRAWISRHSNDELRAYLAGEALGAVERDVPSGPVPHGVSD